MKNIALLILTVIITTACKEEIEMPVTGNCSLPFEDQSPMLPENEKYQRLIDDYVARGLPGIILLIQKGDNPVWIGASGVSRIENQQPLEKCQLVYAASISKTFCAVATLKLVEDGSLDLDNPINRYLDAHFLRDIPNANTATIRHLLNNSSGIPNYENNERFLADAFNDILRDFSDDDFMDYIRGKDPKFKPGTDYHYSSTNFFLLTKIMDKVTGDHAQVYTDRIIRALALPETYYRNEPGYPNYDGLFNGYFDRLDNGNIENISDALNHYTRLFKGGDGVITSAYDLYQFSEALFEGDLLQPGTLEAMTAWVTERGTPELAEYGLGIRYRETAYGPAWGHAGAAIGASSEMFYFPEQGTHIIIATNTGTFLDGRFETLADQLWLDALEAAFN